MSLKGCVSHCTLLAVTHDFSICIVHACYGFTCSVCISLITTTMHILKLDHWLVLFKMGLRTINNHKTQWLNRTNHCSYSCLISTRPAGCSPHYSHQDLRPAEGHPDTCLLDCHVRGQRSWQSMRWLCKVFHSRCVSSALILLTKPPWLSLLS